jgi:DedD protein
MRTYVEEEEKESLYAGQDTEITLGMKSLLGVFFGSVLVCGVFFGFGYSLGRGNAHPAPSAGASSPAIAVQPSTNSDSPSTTNESAQVQSPPIQSSEAEPEPSGNSDVKTIVSDPSATNPSAATPIDTQYDYVATPGGPARKPAGAPLHAVTKPRAGITAPPSAPGTTALPSTSASPAPAPALTAVRPAPPAAAASAPAPAPATGSTMVQIAAISRQEDAAILVSALKKRGYSVVIRNEPKDSLLHVQIGPFASRDDARAMRTRLLADGYNAILK